MSNPTKQIVQNLPVILSLKEIAELVVKQKELHEGLYSLAFQFQIAVGAVGPSPETAVPGAMLGVSGIGLEKVEKAGPHTIDAAIVNPAQPPETAKPKRKAATKSARKKTGI